MFQRVPDPRMPDAASSYPRFNYRHPVYLRARAEAFARSRGVCQECGQPAVEAHHWSLQYPPAHATTADDLIALCAICHRLTTTTRRFARAGGSRYQLQALYAEAVARCDLNSPSPASPPSSFTTARPDSTPEALSAARSQRSRQRRPATAPLSKSSGSSSLDVNSPSISTMTSSPRYREQRFGR